MPVSDLWAHHTVGLPEAFAAEIAGTATLAQHMQLLPDAAVRHNQS
jgi:hypothetical protein